MSVSLFIFTFINVWWISLFAILPFGVRRVESPEPMHDAGAPEKANLKKKFLINTVVALAITYGIHLLLLWAPVDLRNG